MASKEKASQPSLDEVLGKLRTMVEQNQIPLHHLWWACLEPALFNHFIAQAKQYPRNAVLPVLRDLFRSDHRTSEELKTYADQRARRTLTREACDAIATHCGHCSVCLAISQGFGAGIVSTQPEVQPASPVSPRNVVALDGVQGSVGTISPGWALGHSGRDDQEEN